jgi:glucokinase
MAKGARHRAQGKKIRIKADEFILAGDIGGTKTNLGIFSMGKRRPLMKVFKGYSSRGYMGIEGIIMEFLSENRYSVKKGMFRCCRPN